MLSCNSRIGSAVRRSHQHRAFSIDADEHEPEKRTVAAASRRQARFPWLYGRTTRGSKFATLAGHSWCAFEADEVRDLFDWDSVVVKGHMELLDPELGSPDAYTRGLTLMRSIVPSSFTDDDPAPHRSILFRLEASEITGRSARPGH